MLEFRGRPSGTDFNTAIAEAAKWKPDLLIYLRRPNCIIENLNET